MMIKIVDQIKTVEYVLTVRKENLVLPALEKF